MHQIILGKKKENRRSRTLAEFENEFLDLCVSHRTDGQALAFAFIIYDFRRVGVAEMLESDKYWDALDDLAGQLLTVFVFNSGLNRGMNRRSSKSEPMIEMMTSIDVGKVLGQYKRQDNFVRDHFDEYVESIGAAVIFFQVHEHDIVDHKMVGIRSETADGSYQEICHLFTNVTARIKDIPSGHRDSQGIWDLIETELDREIAQKTVVSAAAVMSKIIGLTGVLAKVVPYLAKM